MQILNNSPKCSLTLVDCNRTYCLVSGKTYTMVGRDESVQTLGIIPCAISWLFKLINEHKQRSGTRFSVRVSAVEVTGRNETLSDLLAEQATSKF